jgi:type I restriction enzyme, S subunit
MKIEALSITREKKEATLEHSLLPYGWRRVRLGDVCDIVARQVDPKLPQYGSLPHVNGENILSGICRLAYLNTASEESMISGKYLFEAGDVLYSKLRPYLRKAVVAEVDGVCSADMYPIKVNHTVLDPHFAAWLLVSDEFTNYADSESRRARMPKLNREQLFAFSAPLPPLNEQKRIVIRINESMGAAERARTAAEAQLKAAKDLPAAYLRAVFNSPESQTWEKKRLGDVCEFVGGMQPPAHTFKRQPQSDYIRLVQIQDFRRDDVAVYIPADEAKRSFDVTDVMIGRYGPPVFQILRGLSGAYNVALMKTVPKVGLLKDFLYYLLQEHSIQSAVIGQSERSAGQSGVQKEFLENFNVRIASIEEQARIAASLKNQIGQAKRIRQILNEQLNIINDLPAALLRQAFTGKL